MHVARLHGLQVELRLATERAFQRTDEVHQLHGAAAADVVEVGGNIACGSLVQQAYDALHDVVNVGEVAGHVAAVEDPDGPAGQNRLGEEHRRHVGAPPGAVDREEAQSRGGYAVEPGVDLCDEFVGALGGRIERHGLVYGIRFGKRHFGVAAVDRARGSVDQMPYGMAAATLQQVDETHQIAVDIGIGILQRIAHAGLGGQIDDDVELFGIEKPGHSFAVLEVHPAEPQLRKRRAPAFVAGGPAGDSQIGQTGEFEPHVIIIVERIDSDDLRSLCEQCARQMMTDESGRSRYEYLHFPFLLVCRLFAGESAPRRPCRMLRLPYRRPARHAGQPPAAAMQAQRAFPIQSYLFYRFPPIFQPRKVALTPLLPVELIAIHEVLPHIIYVHLYLSEYQKLAPCRLLSE